MAHEPLIPRDGFYHYGIVVRDFDAALEELGTTLDLEPLTRTAEPELTHNGSLPTVDSW